jgi:cytochrome c oxidase assembly protein subunit 15
MILAEDRRRERQRRRFFVLAAAAAALTLVVVVASAVMRHTQAGLSCADWPACYGLIDPDVARALPHSAIQRVRIVHRVAASTATALILLMALSAWLSRPGCSRQRIFASGAVLVVAALAALGVAGPSTNLPAVALANLLGGHLLLVMLASSMAVARASSEAEKGTRALALLALTAAFGQALVGGLIGTQYALRVCSNLDGCGAWSWHQLAAGGALNPLRAPVAVAGQLVAPAGAAGLVVLHRVGSLLFVALAMAAAAWLHATRPRTALVIVVLTLIQAGLGFALLSTRTALPLAVLHNCGAALLAATLAAAATASGATSVGALRPNRVASNRVEPGRGLFYLRT